MISCPRCNSDNDPAAMHCRGCGSPLRSPATRVMPPPPPQPPPNVSLRMVRADGGPESVVRMTRDSLTIGRQAEISMPDDPFVMPVQARFFFSGGRLAVEDVGGANGLFLRLRQEREVLPGGELRMGRQRLVLEAMAALPTAALVSWGSPDPGHALRLRQMLEGGLQGAAFPLREGDNLLGREVGDITFPTDGFVSGRHALLHVSHQRLTVRDIGSSNGTFVRLDAATFVEDGDQLLLGRQLIRVELQPA